MDISNQTANTIHMPIWNNEPYRRINDSCKCLMEKIKHELTPIDVLPQLVRALIDAERFKREMRGIPPLKAHALSELIRPAPRHRNRPPAIRDITVRPEQIAPKESLNPAQPSPPPPPAIGESGAER
jgi:hypothetical protein